VAEFLPRMKQDFEEHVLLQDMSHLRYGVRQHLTASQLTGRSSIARHGLKITSDPSMFNELKLRRGRVDFGSHPSSGVRPDRSPSYLPPGAPRNRLAASRAMAAGAWSGIAKHELTLISHST
jgi:hypothetical protein